MPRKSRNHLIPGGRESLRQGYLAVLDYIDKMEQFSRFQDRLDVVSGAADIYGAFLDDLRKLIPVEVFAAFVDDAKTHDFMPEYVYPESRRKACIREVEYQTECGIFAWILNRRLPALIPPLTFQNRKTLVMLPLSTHRKTLGVVLILTTLEENAFTQESLKLLALVARQAALVLENTRLYEELRGEHENLMHAQNQVLQAEKLSSIGRLSSGASHEILNPLNILSSHVQMLQLKKSADERSNRYLTIIREQTDRISKIVKSLTYFSRAGETRVEQVNINELMEKILALVSNELTYEGIELIRELPPDLKEITADVEALSLVFFSILSNARQAMPEGGILTVSTRETPPESRAGIEIGVKDTGCGIPPENLSKIFEPFFSGGEGAGLGLSLSYGIIREHGGEMNVLNRVDRGTEVRIFLPFTRTAVKKS